MQQLLEQLLSEQDNMINEISSKGFKRALTTGLVGTAALLGTLQTNAFADSDKDVKTIAQPRHTMSLNKDTSKDSAKASIEINMDKIVQIESSGNPKAENKRSGARGLCQLVKGTWEECTQRLKKDWPWDNDAFDGPKNLVVGTYYMNKRIPEMLRHFGLPDTVAMRLSCYNWGIKGVKDAYKAYGDKWLEHAPAETQNYVKKYNR